MKNQPEKSLKNSLKKSNVFFKKVLTIRTISGYNSKAS